jgi:hypothetical protein
MFLGVGLKQPVYKTILSHLSTVELRTCETLPPVSLSMALCPGSVTTYIIIFSIYLV